MNSYFGFDDIWRKNANLFSMNHHDCLTDTGISKALEKKLFSYCEMSVVFILILMNANE